MAGFQQLDIARMLKFEQAAAHQASINGPHISKQKFVDFGFEGTSTLYGWSSTTDKGMTLAQGAVDGGAMTLTLGGVDEDCGELVHTAQWSPAYNCGMFAKLKISAITEVCVTVGFVDAKENTNDHVAGEIDATTLRNMSTTADWTGFTFDTDQDTDVFYVSAQNNGTEGTPVAAVGALAPVANTYFYVCVQTDTEGNVSFYYGTKIDQLVAVGYRPAAIAYASTNLLAPYIGFLAHTATALVCTVSRVILWQDN